MPASSVIFSVTVSQQQWRNTLPQTRDARCAHVRSGARLAHYAVLLSYWSAVSSTWLPFRRADLRRRLTDIAYAAAGHSLRTALFVNSSITAMRRCRATAVTSAVRVLYTMTCLQRWTLVDITLRSYTAAYTAVATCCVAITIFAGMRHSSSLAQSWYEQTWHDVLSSVGLLFSLSWRAVYLPVRSLVGFARRV